MSIKKDVGEITIRAFSDKVYLIEDDDSQYCASYKTVVKTLVDVNKDFEVKPLMRIYNHSNYPVIHVGETLDGHDKIVDRAKEQIEQQNIDYWRGYKDGCDGTWEEIGYKMILDGKVGEEHMMEIGEMFVENNKVVCARNKALFPLGEWARPDGSYVATIYNEVANKCVNCGADYDEYKTCVKKTHNARKADVYKCKACGTTWKGVITG